MRSRSRCSAHTADAWACTDERAFEPATRRPRPAGTTGPSYCRSCPCSPRTRRRTGSVPPTAWSRTPRCRQRAARSASAGPRTVRRSVSVGSTRADRPARSRRDRLAVEPRSSSYQRPRYVGRDARPRSPAPRRARARRHSRPPRPRPAAPRPGSRLALEPAPAQATLGVLVVEQIHQPVGGSLSALAASAGVAASRSAARRQSPGSRHRRIRPTSAATCRVTAQQQVVGQHHPVTRRHRLDLCRQSA